jgi:rRNA maturation endonuclease Nob1
MVNVILDTNIILRQPKVLGLQIPGIHFLIPIDVVEELNRNAARRGASSDGRINIIEKAVNQGTVSIINSDAPKYNQYKNSINYPRLSGADIAIVAIASELLNKEEEVKIATLDNEIRKFAQENGIEVLSESDVSGLLASFVEPKYDAVDTVQKEIVSYENKEKRNFISGILAGASATAVSFFIHGNIKNIINTINIWGTIIVTLGAGILLFVFREKYRLSYGVFEFLVGVFTIIMLFKPINFNISALNFTLDFNIKLLGGLYIMVRGQDNIIKGIKDTKIGLYLKDEYGIGR